MQSSDSSNLMPKRYAANRAVSAALHHIQVRGAVRTPGRYNYQSDRDVLFYLKQAGALDNDVPQRVTIVRRYGTQSRSLIFKLDSSGTLPKVRQGDVLVFHTDGEVGDSAPNSSKPVQESAITQIAREALAMSPEEAELELFPAPQAIKHTSDPKLRAEIEDYIRKPTFKRLLNQIATAQVALNMRSMAVISSEKSEGKSFMVAALAMGYARFLNSQVLIIDTNRTQQEGLNYVAAVAGEYTDPGAAAENGGEPLSVDLYTMDMIENGMVESSDFLIGPFIESVRLRYDLILLDTCGINAATEENVDPIVVAHQAEGAILVTSPKSANKAALKTLKQELHRLDVRLVGAVFNPGADNE